jgi:adenylosuccinate synthase
VRYIIAISGPVAVGKSALADELLQRFSSHRISTRQLLIDTSCQNERDALIEAGKRLDTQTGGRWVRDGIARYVTEHEDKDVILVDAVRTAPQIAYLRETYGERLVHVHVTAPFEVVKKRYEGRGSIADTGMTYDQVRADPTEASVWSLDGTADRVVVNHNREPASLLALAVAGLGLFPLDPTPSVDVIVGGQYGSEGKGHVCAHLASGYDVLVRVGGPNAGHRVAYPPYDYIQLPSGTQSNVKAKILIGPGATIRPSQMMKEIRECGLEGGSRLVIDERAMIIEDNDAEIEAGPLESIGSTKQGVGVATARKILNRGDEPIFGSKVRLAQHHLDLKPYVGSTARHLEDAYAAGLKIMLEGTQGTGLSIHHGSYPHVTSRETTAAGCLADAGISPRRVRKIVMLTRTYPIRVGGASGPIGIEINAQTIADRSGLPVSQIEKTEVGTVSGKKRRMAEFDWEQLRRSASLNGATDIALSFSDYITAGNQNATRYDQLSVETHAFIAEVERVANAPVTLISTKFDRFGVIDRRNWR